MTIAFVLGNGISRHAVDLTQLKSLGKIYGCNALYREFTPDVLVATDKPISKKIQELGYAKVNRFYTRRPIVGSGAQLVIPEYHGYSSGPNALALAATDGHSKIFLLGFDMGPTQNNLFNNIYADTEFYKTSQYPPTFTGNWIKQIHKVITDFPLTRFYRISGETTAQIPELATLINLTHQDLPGFIYRINNKKDL